MPESIEHGSGRNKVALEEILVEAADKLPEASRARIRGNVLSSVATETRSSFAGAGFMRAAAAFSALAIGMGGLSYAAASAVPGSALYPVKRAMEETQVVLILGDTSKADVLQGMAEERVREMHRLIEIDAPRESMGEAVTGFEDAAERAIEADPEQARQRASEIEKSAQGVPGHVQDGASEEMPVSSPEPEKDEATDSGGSSESGHEGSQSRMQQDDSGHTDDSGSEGPSGRSDDSGGYKP